MKKKIKDDKMEEVMWKKINKQQVPRPQEKKKKKEKTPSKN